MNNNIIEIYTWNILKKQLQKYKVDNNILYDIIDDVKKQLGSLIYHWNDLDFRKAILILGSEEGDFYEPISGEIANMVVVAIRNSLLEGVASSYYKNYGASKILEDRQIKEITSEAIIYFSKFELSSYAQKIELENDFYGDIIKKYPVAFEALKELAKCTNEEREHSYEKLEIQQPYELSELENNDSNSANIVNVESGISPNFNTSLCEFLRGIKEGKSKIFLTDSFKMVTRNFEKMLRILEFILTHDASFVTCNYLITNNYVSRRKDLLKAGHHESDFFGKLDKINDISEHSDVLKSIQELL